MTRTEILAAPVQWPRQPRRRLPKGVIGIIPAVLFLLLFFIAPLIDNTINSLQTAQGWSAGNYVRLLTDQYFLSVIFRTLWVSLIATVICVLIGYPVAYHLVRHSGAMATVLIFLLVAPLMTSILMRTYGWQVLLARGGMVNTVLLGIGLIDKPLRVIQSPISVMIGIVHILVPYMVISIAAVLQGVDRRLEEAASILGAGPVRSFINVTLPLSLPGVITGSIIVFMMANGSFLTMLLLGNNSVVTLPVLIYQQFTLVGDAKFSAAMGNILLVLALMCLFLQLRLVRGKGGIQ
ncbi:ABC transporter permease [Falsochrobactrum shanghaiense]|uniref:ABC transporter permease n=1 Tax=Falsochrobactrum shanghaiense TaxID=2201899 RepID=A0A316JDB4_9HYPH|nr:ABC transporter permease [Falsochrobactrum shanghaiense]PWL19484.1 ABC transporter permease [Falsochrobactrum shanghaiense]